MFCFSLTCMVSISSCKQANDNKTEVQEVNMDVPDESLVVQEAAITETDAKIESATIDFTSKKDVFLDSIQLYYCDSYYDHESFFHFYYKGERYTQEIYFAGIDDNFSIKHMNKDKYLDIVYENSSASGQGCLAQDIFIFDHVLKKYLRNDILSAGCYIGYNHKYDVYSGYSRGSGQMGPWYFNLFKLQRDTISVFESLLEESEVIFTDPDSLNRMIKMKYTHFCHGDTIIYEGLDEFDVNKDIWMSQVYDPNTRCQFIKQDRK